MDGLDDVTRIYLVTGDDQIDDPARGIEPLFTGDERSARDWLLEQADIARYSVIRGLKVSWACEFLERGDGRRSRSGP